VFFFILFFSLHLVSVCSLSAYSFFFLQVLILGALGRFHMAVPYVIEMDILAAVLTGLCFWQHRSNIRRLMRGEEKKVYLHRSLNEEVQKGRR
jgi:glycerol-3-phosphate acyltransferase PlsY